jgi:cellulose synthase/poly-beta-1,6-N-acetylglucosamine synthase-like glycosyltransferase
MTVLNAEQSAPPDHDLAPVFGDADAQRRAEAAWHALRRAPVRTARDVALVVHGPNRVAEIQGEARRPAPEPVDEAPAARAPRPSVAPGRRTNWATIPRPQGHVAAPPAAYGPQWFLRRFFVLIALAPIGVLLATRVAHLRIDPVLGIYAVLTLTTTALVMYLGFARYRDPSKDDPLFADPTRVYAPLASCMVAVKDERELIARCVLSLLESTYANKEVVVVDDGSTDGTSERLDAIAADYPQLRVIHLPQSVGKKRALTRAVLEASGEILVFTDSDCVLKEDAIERVIAAFRADRDLGACSGHARALNANQSFLTRVQDTWYEGQFSVWKAAEASLGSVSCISGPLAAFRREAVYPFFSAWAEDRFLGREFPFATDRQLTGYVLGNHIVGEKLKRRHAHSPFVQSEHHPTRHWKVGYVKSARVWTEVPHSLRRLIKQQVRWKKSFIRNLCFTGRFYWRRGPVASYLFYSHVLFILAMPFMVFRHLVWMPAHGELLLTALYLCGLFFKGSVWALAFKAEDPKSPNWIFRPFMSLLTAFFGPLILYSALTLRKTTWSRG